MNKKIFWLIIAITIVISSLVLFNSKKENEQEKTIIQKEIVRVGYREHGAYWPLFLGIEKGFFAKENIIIEKIPFNSTNQLMEALIAGQIDAALGGVNTTLLATLENKSPGEFKLFTLFNESRDKNFTAILVKTDSKINSLSDLAGKKVSTQPGSTTKFLFKKSINDKIAPNEAILEQMNADLQLSSLEAGQTDAAIVFEPTATIAVNQGMARIIGKSLWSNDIMENCPVGGSILSKKFLADKPELAKKFVLAVNKTITYGKNNERDVNASIAMYTPLTIDLVEKVPVLENKLINEIDIKQLQDFFDLLLKEGEIKNPINAKEILLPAYAENK